MAAATADVVRRQGRGVAQHQADPFVAGATQGTDSGTAMSPACSAPRNAAM